MKRTNNIDDFFDKQPKLEFIEELKKPLHQYAPINFNKRNVFEGEISANGIYLDIKFEDPCNLLETCYNDFNTFLSIYSLYGNKYPIRIVKGDTRCFEAYQVIIGKNGCTIVANDTEGIRRSIVWLEDEFKRREGAFLPEGTIERYPHIRRRITRGFFSPTNRAPKYGDELYDDIDYYPEEYLNRLAHDGTNGIWIYSRFSQIIPSEYIIEYGQGFQKRIDKLNKVIEKCARYGIQVYIFSIEPEALSPDLASKYKEVLGATGWDGKHAFCINTDFGRNYCVNATKKLFELSPDLAGIICITHGERVTSCAPEDSDNCPRCRQSEKGKNLSKVLDALKEGMRQSKPEAEFISWTYGHRVWDFKDIRDYVESSPSDCILMQNFDDMIYAEQLGRKRVGVDYWLSVSGPSEMFKITAEAAMKSGNDMYAKMQVCCSHELASVPYIPVPGLLFEKYKEAYKYNVKGVMQCWYFGNYPSIMSKAAGELAFLNDFSDKDKFLYDLAAIHYGNTKAKDVVKAWKYFESGYKNYPLNIMFSYYGPMHDGVVWELSLLPKNFSLSRSWMLLDKTNGDRIGEALLCGHTLDEAITLCELINKDWKEGTVCFPERDIDTEEQVSIIKALEILFESGLNILKFYKLREYLGYQTEENLNTILDEMSDLVYKEIENSTKMIRICENDKRIGYHSEAEGFKFFADKLKYRIQTLKNLLHTKFPIVYQRISNNLPPLEYYQGIDDNDVSYHVNSGYISKATWVSLNDSDSRFRMAHNKEYIYIEIESTKNMEFILSFEFRLMWPYPPIIVKENGELRLGFPGFHDSLFGDVLKNTLEKLDVNTIVNADRKNILLTIKKEGTIVKEGYPLKLRIANGQSQSLWCVDENPVYTLGKSDASPGDFGWIFLDSNANN